MIFYFGWMKENQGHYLWGPDGFIVREQNLPPDFPLHIEGLDGCLLRYKLNGQGVCCVWRTDGWVVIAFPDYTGDSRPGSNSVIVAKSSDSDVDVIAAFSKVFPDVAKRIGKLILPNGSVVPLTT